MHLQQDWEGFADPGCEADAQHRQLPSPTSPWASAKSPSRRHEDQGTSSSAEGSPGQNQEGPAGVDSDDNFEVSDDADEQQVGPACCVLKLACLPQCSALAGSRVT